jgi:hypothetical protein
VPEPITDDVVVTRGFMNPDEGWGLYALCYMQVCAHGETPPERIEERANALNPPGTSHPWRLVHGHEPYDGDGPNPANLAPVQCHDDPVRLHWMLSC